MADLPPKDDRAPGEAAVLQSMTLLATLQTAVDVWEAAKERRAGRDPSAQEPAGVTRPYLRAAARALQELHRQLHASYVLAERRASAEEEEGALTASVRRFDQLMKLGRAERLLQGMHQRLLSLYPDVSEALVEEARQVHAACEVLREDPAEDFLGELRAFLDRLAAFAERTRRELRTRL